MQCLRVHSCDEVEPSQDPWRCQCWAGPGLSCWIAQESSTPGAHVTSPQGSLQRPADIHCSPCPFPSTRSQGDSLPGLCLCPRSFAVRIVGHTSCLGHTVGPGWGSSLHTGFAPNLLLVSFLQHFVQNTRFPESSLLPSPSASGHLGRSRLFSFTCVRSRL